MMRWLTAIHRKGGPYPPTDWPIPPREHPDFGAAERAVAYWVHSHDRPYERLLLLDVSTFSPTVDEWDYLRRNVAVFAAMYRMAYEAGYEKCRNEWEDAERERGDYE